MAIVKFIPPIHMGSGGRGTYAHLQRAIAYVLNPAKTAGGLYTGSQNCVKDTAFCEMVKTKKHYGKEPVRPTDRVGYHMILSWSPNEAVAPETALDIVKEFCGQYLAEYELVYGVHLDTEHRHAHIVFNSVNYKTGKMYRYENGEWASTLQPLLDRLCAERGLHTLSMDTGMAVKDYPKYSSQKKKGASGGRKGNQSYENGKAQEYNYSQYLRQLIDQMVLLSSSYEAFEKSMEEAGYQLKYGKSEKYGEYLSIRGEGMRQFRRTQTLGKDYTLSMFVVVKLFCNTCG